MTRQKHPKSPVAAREMPVKPRDPRKVGVVVALGLLLFSIAFYEYASCDAWLAQNADGVLALTKTCKCRGWNIQLYNQIAEDGPQKFICVGVPYSTPGQPLPEDQQTPESQE